MADTYIDPSATSNGSGTLASPYNTWAGRSASGASRLLQRYGTTTTVPIAPTGNGTAGSRAIIGVYEPMTGAFMDGVKGGAFVDATGQSYGIGLGAARTYVTVTGFEVFGGTNYGILKESTASSSTEAQHNWVENCILRASLGVGADLRGLGNKVRNCDVYGNASDGLFIVGDSFELGHSRLWGNGLTNAEGDCVQIRDGSAFWIHDSDLDHSLSPYKQAFIATLENVLGTTGGTIERSRIACAQFVDGVTAADQKTLQILTPGVIVRQCDIEGGQFGAYMQGANGVLEDCLLIVTGAGAVVGVAIREDGVAVRRNTIIGEGAYGIDHSSADYTGVTVNGNALKGWAAGIRTHTGATYSHNGFEDCAIRNANSGGTEGSAGTGDKTGDLGLSAGYALLPGSQLLGAGVYLGPARDRRGLQRPNPPSIGAFDRATLTRIE